MDMVSALFSGLLQVFSWSTLSLMMVGIAVGFVVGILPGLGGPTAMALMLPFVFKMNAVEAFAFLLGMTAVTATTGDITSVLFGVPGEPTTASTIVDGRLHTGDVGRLDEDGYLTLVDRIKDMIIRGGENIYPKEIENALATHPDVLECAVVGAPDELYGELPVAFVVAYPGRAVDAETLAAHLAGRLAKVKQPSIIQVVDQLPRNPVGKIDKPALRSGLRSPQPI